MTTEGLKGSTLLKASISYTESLCVFADDDALILCHADARVQRRLRTKCVKDTEIVLGRLSILQAWSLCQMQG